MKGTNGLMNRMMSMIYLNTSSARNDDDDGDVVVHFSSVLDGTHDVNVVLTPYIVDRMF